MITNENQSLARKLLMEPLPSISLPLDQSTTPLALMQILYYVQKLMSRMTPLNLAQGLPPVPDEAKNYIFKYDGSTQTYSWVEPTWENLK